MYPTPELAAAVQQDRARALAEATLARVVEAARSCCAAPMNLVQRVVRLVRPVPQAC